MGLLDVVNGVLAGPRGQAQQQATTSGGGMSPITMAVLGLLAYKAFKGRRAGAQGTPADQPDGGSGGLGGMLGGLLGGSSGAQGASADQAGAGGGGLGGMLGGLLGGSRGGQGGLGDLAGGLGSLFGGAAAGSTLTSGLSNLVNDLKSSGVGAAQSWVGSGPNEPVSPQQLGAGLGNETVDALSRQTGMSRDDLLAALSRHLPEVVDRLTPNGRLPSQGEAQQLAAAR